MPGNSRSKKIILTNEARLLKKWRLSRGLSLREVGKELGKNHSTIAHIESGRMAVPKGEYLRRLLAFYGINGERTLYIMARELGENTSPEDEASELIKKMNPEQVNLLLRLIRKIMKNDVIIFG